MKGWTRAAALVACLLIAVAWADPVFGQLATPTPGVPGDGVLLESRNLPATVAADQETQDSILLVTLPEALRRAAGVDPNYVAALRQVGDADWVRRKAWSAFLLPSIEFRWSLNRFSSEQFCSVAAPRSTTCRARQQRWTEPGPASWRPAS